MDTALVAYSEIALKSKPVRRQMENMLVENLRYALIRNGLAGARISRTHGRIFIENVNAEKAAEVASRVFGVALSMPAVKTSSSMEDVVKTAADLAAKTIGGGQTFAVRARRAGKHPYTSKDIERQAGSAILERFSGKDVRVNLDDPDKVVHVEVRENVAYVYSQVFEGPAGLPLGSQGKTVVLLSGGVDSATAAWLLMKRGALVIPLYLNTSPYGDEICHRRVRSVAEFLRGFVTLADYRLATAPYGNILTEFIQKCPRKLTCVLCKRTMYRIACRFAERRGAKAIVTGESLGQVASQTLSNLNVLDEAASLPVFRPLIGMNKDEIEKLAKRIGIQKIAAVRVRPCGAVPHKPATVAKLQEIKEAEKSINLDRLIDEALGKMEERLL